MKNILCYFLFFILNVLILNSQNQTIPINSQWQFKQSDKSEWLPAIVPGNIHSDLLKNKVIKDPFYAENEKDVQWIEEKDWEYKTTFNCDASLLKNQHVEMIFEGLDTYAAVYLNDSLILKCNNMFRSWRTDVKGRLHTGSNNLRVVFESTVKQAKKEVAKLNYTLPEGERVFARKAQFQFGWDFAPRFVGCGIWKPVKFEVWNDLKINSVLHNITVLNDSLAKINFIVETVCKKEGNYSFLISSPNKTLVENRTTVSKKMETGFHTDTLRYQITKPKLWWTNGLGEAYLYDFLISLGDKKKSIQTTSLSIGLRSLELVKEMDSIGTSFYFELNGVPVFMKGANYIPGDALLRPKLKSEYEKELKACKESHMNMLRVWGGGVYADDEFYKTCDEQGILVWQDLMFACAMYPGDTAFISNVRQEVTEQIIRLRNHASIALWCGNNEIDEAWRNWGWQKQFKYAKDDSSKIWNDYVNLFHKVIPELVYKYNSATTYWFSSPSFGWGYKKSLTQGDSHYWGVWWGMEPFEIYEKRVGRFVSEYGFQGMPDVSTFKKFCPDSVLSLNSSVINSHQKHKKGFQTIQTYMDRSYKPVKGFENHTYISQLLQRDGMRIAIEAHRRTKPICMGTLFWQLNDCWPGTSWSAIDYYRQPKAFYYALKDLYKTQAVSVIHTDSLVIINAISDSLQSFAGKVSVKICRFRSEVLWQRNYPVKLSNTKVSVIAIDKREFSRQDTSQCYVKVEVSSLGKNYATKYHYLTLPKNLKLPKAKLDFVFIDRNTVEISSDVFVKDVFIYTDKMDLIFSANYFDLEAGQKKRITLSSPIKESDLAQFKTIVFNNL